MDNPLDQAEELREYAKTLRSTSNEYDVLKYMERAIDAGAFSGPQWATFKVEFETFVNEAIGFVLLIEWIQKNRSSFPIEIDANKHDGDVAYWGGLFAVLIEREAEAIEKAYHSAPKNYWENIHRWWQHSRWATASVVFVGVISAVGGLIAFIREVMGLFGMP